MTRRSAAGSPPDGAVAEPVWKRLASGARLVGPPVQAALALATLASALYALDQQLSRSIGGLELTLWWWTRILVIYLPPVMLAAVAAALVRLAHRAPGVRLVSRLAGIAALVALFVVNRPILTTLRALAPPVALLVSASLVAASGALALLGLRSNAARRFGFVLSAAAPILLLVGMKGDHSETSLRKGEVAKIEVRPERPDRLLVLGLDGADWTWIDAMADRGELPNLTRLRELGAWGHLETIQPTLSPLLWTTVATGRTPAEHGVHRIQVRRPRGFEIGAQGARMRVRGLGLRHIQSLLTKTGQLVLGSVTGSERKVPAIWNILSQAGRTVSVTSWWATWPAEPVRGRIVSDRVYYDRAWARGANDAVTDRLTFPASLTPRMRRLVVRPQDVSYASARVFVDVSEEEFEEFLRLPYSHHEVRSELRLYLSMFESDRNFTRELLRQDRENSTQADAFFALFRILDLTSHCCLRYSTLVADTLDSTDEDLSRYDEVTAEAYRQVDALVGEIVRDFDEANVLLLSDHGFQLERKGGDQARYDHDTAPPGIFLGVGPAFRPGRIDDLSIFDIMPLVLYLQGLPIAEDMEGSLPRQALRQEVLAENPPRKIATYDFVPIPRGRAAAFASDQEILEEFRALGYIQ